VVTPRLGAIGAPGGAEAPDEAPVKHSTVLHLGPDRLRVAPWRGDARTAVVAPVVPGSSPEPWSVHAALARLKAEGYRRVITSALNPTEQQGFLAAGFDLHEHLHLLTHRLGRPAESTPQDRAGTAPTATLPATSSATIRRARRRDRATVLRIDAAAFDAFWRFDADGLREALAATPVSRFRVAHTDRVVGYAVTGRSHDHGYLQRLAVDPREHGRGLGRALVLDALDWLRRRGATSALVNTQQSNTAALALYERLGFEREAHGLDVLVHELGASDAGR
jgi:ribosomal protein S18 acetylase RimI-like enzyme